MSLEPISIRDMEDQSGDIYESVVVMSKRAKQVLSDRIVEEIIESNAKVEILSYYLGAPENPDAFTDPSRYYTFNYVYQPNEGATTFD